MDNTDKQVWSLNIFVIFSIISLILWSMVVLTTSVDRIPITNFPLFQIMPIIYWVGFLSLMVAIITWHFSSETKPIHLVLLLLLVLYLFIGPQLIEAGSRGVDALDHLTGVNYINQNRFSEYFYKGWPVFAFYSNFISQFCMVSYAAFQKCMLVILDLLRVIFILLLGNQLFEDKKQALLFGLLLTGCWWASQSFDPSPQNLGILIFLCLIALLLRTKQPNASELILLITLYSTLVITHVLTAFIAMLLILLIFILSKVRNKFSYNRSSGFELATLCILIFTTYLMYSVHWVFAQGIQNLIIFLKEPSSALENTVYYLHQYSKYRSIQDYLVYVFFAILILWLLLITIQKKFWGKFSLNRFFPLFCIIPISATLIAYGSGGVGRMYTFAIPFIAWFIVNESPKIGYKRFIIPFFLIIIVSLNIINGYAEEFCVYTPVEEFSVSKFICNRLPEYSAIFAPSSWDPEPTSLANSLDGPRTTSPAAPNGIDISEIHYALWSTAQKNKLIYYTGGDQVPQPYQGLYSPENDIIYISTNSEIYMIPFSR